MAGWGEDTTEIKTGSPASLTLGKDGKVRRINLSDRQVDQTALPMNVTAYDLEDKLTITGLVLGETKTYEVDHDATIVEEDGTELRIAPKDVQYQNASIWGRLITNFAGPMNNFILGVLVFIILAFVQDKIFGGFQMAWEGATAILATLKGLITNFSLNKLGGPVAMFQMSAQASESGLISILDLMGMLSINLGIFNLIPIPALDGGKIVMNIIEAIRRKPLNQEIESYITLAGVAVMVVLMIAVTWNDIMRAFF